MYDQMSTQIFEIIQNATRYKCICYVHIYTHVYPGLKVFMLSASLQNLAAFIIGYTRPQESVDTYNNFTKSNI